MVLRNGAAQRGDEATKEAKSLSESDRIDRLSRGIVSASEAYRVRRSAEEATRIAALLPVLTRGEASRLMGSFYSPDARSSV